MENVLIVEDNGILAIELQRKLQDWGYNVPKIALSGKEAVIRANDKDTDLVIMDIALKGEIDGITAAREIENKSEIPILFYGALDDKTTLNQVKNFKNGDFISKASSDEDLKLILENTLKRGVKMSETGETHPKIKAPSTNFRESVEDYYKARENIQNEFKKLESNFSKVYNESVTREREIEELKTAEKKYISIINEKDAKLSEMMIIQNKLKENINLHKEKQQKLLKETEDLKKHMDSMVSILNGE